MDTQNIDLSIPTKILKRIKVIAARRGVSVSGLLTRLLECDVVWSEDFNHGQVYDRVVVKNPFIA